MNETTNNCRASRAHNPFDDGARERLRRMELLTEMGSVEASALTALAHTFAGLLFDDLCDASQDYSGVQTELQQLFDAVDRAEPRQKFLLLCLQYNQKYFVYLERLRQSGETNMYGAAPYLQAEFPELRYDRNKAGDILLAWIRTFNEKEDDTPC